jgi:hypothetical protein
MLALPTRAPDPASCFPRVFLVSQHSHRQRKAQDVTMAEEYRDYLAARILTESKPVSWSSNMFGSSILTPPRLHIGFCLVHSRWMSILQSGQYAHDRARIQLTWHSMLFDFHQKQNAKKPNSIHATYLVTGTQRTTEPTNGTNGKHGEDVDMRSSPFMSSMPEPEESEDSEDSDEEPDKETTILLVREEELEGS